jgi:hypothetical protein
MKRYVTSRPCLELDLADGTESRALNQPSPTSLVGLMLGWRTGSFTTTCTKTAGEADVYPMAAVGTWVGGLGTIAAVLR